MAYTNGIARLPRLLASIFLLPAAITFGQASSNSAAPAQTPPKQAAPVQPTVQTAPAQTGPLKLCAAKQLSLAVDPEGGEFDGMSHGGVLLVIRNISSTLCQVAAFPDLTFGDKAHHPLDIVRENTTTLALKHAMHPGPVVLPVPVAPGAELTSSMRWIASDVSEKANCVNPTILTLTIGNAELTIPIQANICGQPKASYTMTKLAPDPVYNPTAAAK